MKVLVTGAAGFIGSHLCEALIAHGDTVYGIDNLSTGRLANIRHLIGQIPDNLFYFARGNAAGPGLEWMYEQCDCIYHLASSVGVRRIIDHPVEAVRNIVGTTGTILELCARYRKPILITSTSEVYGKGNSVPFYEDDDVVLGPTSSPRWAYAAAKMVDEFLALAYYRETGLPVRIVRLFNTVGPRQTGQYGMVVPTFVAQAKAGGPITVYGDGNQTRCFSSIHDIAPGLISIMEREKSAGQVVNLGSDKEVSINDLALAVAEAVDPHDAKELVAQKIPLKEAYGIAFDDMRRRVPDLTKACNLIGWAPKWKLADILRELCDAQS